jgi:TRAP-type C4-dicarboxylate transport system permease small subunit
MKIVWRLWDLLLDAMVAVSGVLVGLIILGVCVDVGLRNLGDHGIPWVFDFVEYAILAITMGMAAHVLRIERHVEVDLVLMYVPASVARVMKFTSMLIVMIVAAILSWYALSATIQSFEHKSVIFRYVLIPEWLPFAAISVMFGTLAIEAMRRAYVHLRAPSRLDVELSDPNQL